MTSAYAEVIGDPIAHSKSPTIHQFWLAALGIEDDYRAQQVTRAGLRDYLASRRGDPAWRGCNVTMPLKLDALLLADQASDVATAAGATNLLVLREGQLIANNTDVTAVRSVLARFASMGAITLLGNGGAARAILLALKMLGVGPVVLQSRDMAAATSLAIEFGLEHRPRIFTAAVDTMGLINATPLGMAGIAPHAIDIAAMPDGGWVFDLVSSPLPTPLLAQASNQGLATIDGLTMLVEQAADSFEALFGQPPPRGRDEQLMALLRA